MVVRWLLPVFFCASGAAGLVLEIVWVRLLSQVFGSTNLAIATVLATFMGGLALGSWLGGRAVDRLRVDPLWAYAACEAGVAISALTVPLVIGVFPGANAWLWSTLSGAPLALALVRFVLCALLLIIPTTFMGATLPILSRAVVQTDADFDAVGGKVATLYAANTAGAVAGSFAAGFWLLPALGQALLHHAAVGSALAIAGGAAALARWRSAHHPGPPVAEAPVRAGSPSSVDARLALAAFAITGAVSMALESVFSRALALVLGSAIQSFTLVLVLFLLGISVGAAVMGRLSTRLSHPVGWLGVTVSASAGALMLVYGWIDDLPAFHYGLVRAASFELDSAAGVGLRALVAAVIFPVTLCMGAVMPLAVGAYARSAATVGSDVGRAYAINTVGAVVGSLCGGFFLLPGLGIGGGITACIAALLVVSVVLATRPQPRRLRAVAVATAGVVAVGFAVQKPMDVRTLSEGMFGFVGADEQQWEAFRRGNKLVYSRDGRSATITVFENGGSYALLNNGKPDGSSHEDVLTQILLGMIPAMFHEQPATRAFVIGYGTGMTVGSLTQAPNVDRVDVVEIEEAVYEAADRFFGPYTHDPHENPAVHRHLGDGRNFLMARGGRYGIIVSEPPDTWVAGVASLFSHEFYREVDKHLDDGGIFCQWVPLYHLRVDTVRMIYRTVRKTFPNVLVFALPNNNSILIATRDPLPISMERLEERMANPRTRTELARANVRVPAQMLALLAFSPDELVSFTGDGRIHTDDSGALEFAAQSDYLLSARTRENSSHLLAEIREAFAPYGDMDGLELELGAGTDRARRLRSIGTELARVGRHELARRWHKRADEAGAD